MKHSEFHIGLEFFTDTGKWRCTDKGTRVIVAISLEPRQVTALETSDDDKYTIASRVSNDTRDLLGPPYSVEEVVFDEYDLPACRLEK